MPLHANLAQRYVLYTGKSVEEKYIQFSFECYGAKQNHFIQIFEMNSYNVIGNHRTSPQHLGVQFLFQEAARVEATPEGSSLFHLDI